MLCGFGDLSSQYILTLSMYILMLPLSMNSAIMCSGEGEMKIEAPPVYAPETVNTQRGHL